MQSARRTNSPPFFSLIALPLASLVGFGAAVVLFTVIGALPSGPAISASPIAVTPMAPIATPQPQYVDTPMQAINCQVTNPASADLLIRSAPDDGFAPLGLLLAGGGVQALGRTTTQPAWYAVGFAERRGWIVESEALLAGDCNGLPLVRNPLVPDAPPDAPAHVIAVDRDGAGAFREWISTPGGDPEDLVWVRVINLYTSPPNNFREFTLRLDCDGASAEAVRWGSIDNPSLRCGDTITFPFIFGSSDRPLTIRLPPGSPQAYIAYWLAVEPAQKGV